MRFTNQILDEKFRAARRISESVKLSNMDALGMNGEYEFNAPFADSILYARMLFLKETATHASQLLTNLYDNCIEDYSISQRLLFNDAALFSMADSYIFRAVFNLIYPELDFYSKGYSGREVESLNSGYLSAGFSEWQLIRQDNRANLLCELIYCWSKRLSLGAEWCCEYAIMTLRLANIINQSKEIVNTRDHYSYLWSFLADAIITIWSKLKMLSIFPDIYPTLEPPQDLPIWKPGLETRSSYLSHAEQQVRNRLNTSILRLLKSKMRVDVMRKSIIRLMITAKRYPIFIPNPIGARLKSSRSCREIYVGQFSSK